MRLPRKSCRISKCLKMNRLVAEKSVLERLKMVSLTERGAVRMILPPERKHSIDLSMGRIPSEIEYKLHKIINHGRTGRMRTLKHGTLTDGRPPKILT